LAGRDGRLSVVGTDGYVALNAYLPPRERRGVVLIDPPFEAQTRTLDCKCARHWRSIKSLAQPDGRIRRA
jgi:23S rRNA A2030 N6-methylase RlmJ